MINMDKLALAKITLPAFLILCFGPVLFAQDAQQGGPPTPGQPTGVTHSPGQFLMKQDSTGGSARRILGPGGPPEPYPEAKAIVQPKNNEELASAIKKLGDTLAKTGRFSGSILLAADGKILVDNAWGEANRSTGAPNTPATAYDVGSIGKLFTQIAVMQLTEQGKLGLDETIAKYLPDYPNKAVAEKVTIRELLLHTSGIPDFFDRLTPETAPSLKIDAVVDLKDFLPLFSDKPLEFAPGSSNRYSNSGYIVLGLIVEAVSRENYRDYIQRHILDPAGMTHAGFFDRAHLPAFVAHSYEDTKDVTNIHPRRGSPAGGLQATASELYRLVEAVDSGKLIKPASINIIRRLMPAPPNAPPLADSAKLTSFGIQGGAPGVNSQLAIDPTGRYTRVVLCNAGPPMASTMGATIRAWIKGMGANLPAAPGERSPASGR